MADQFGGIPIDEAKPDQFGGVPVPAGSSGQSVSPATEYQNKNYGTDTTDTGVFGHAKQLLTHDIPEAVISGSAVSAPFESMRDSMSEYVGKPSFGNMVRAIPGVGYAEDMLSAPYRRAASGDTGGAWDDAALLAAGIGSGLKGAVPETYRESSVPGPNSSLLPEPGPVSGMLMRGAGRLSGIPVRSLYEGAKSAGMTIPGRSVTSVYGGPEFRPGMSLETSEVPSAFPPSRQPGFVEPPAPTGPSQFSSPDFQPVQRPILPSGKTPGGIQNMQETPVQPRSATPVAPLVQSGTVQGNVVPGHSVGSQSVGVTRPLSTAEINAASEAARQARLGRPGPIVSPANLQELNDFLQRRMRQQ